MNTYVHLHKQVHRQGKRPDHPDPGKEKGEFLAHSLVMEEIETISISGFNNMEEIPLTDIETRLDTLDPRIDPYMIHKKEYFYPGKNMKTVYIDSPLHPLLFFIKAYTYFRQSYADVYIPDIRIKDIILCFCAGFLFIILFFTMYKKESKAKLTGLCGIIPWISGLVSGDILALMSFFLLYPTWFFLYEEIFLIFKNHVIYEWKKDKADTLVRRSIALSLCFGISSLMIFLQGTSSYTFIISLFTDILIIPISLLSYTYSQRKKKHRIFEPVPIRLLFKKTYLPAKVKKIPFLLLIGVVILLFSIYYFHQVPLNQTEAIYPVREAENKPITLGNLETLWKEKKPEYAPDLSDLIVHLSYQEGLLFGTTYTFPSYTEGLKVSYFEKDPFTGKIMKSKGIVKEYNKTWLNNVRSHINVHSVEYMLFRQGKAIHAKKHPIGDFYQCRYPHIQIILLFAAAFIMVFFYDFHLTPSGLYDTKRLAIRRWSKTA